MTSRSSNGWPSAGKQAKSWAGARSAKARTKAPRVRRANGGDTARSVTAKGIEGFEVSEAVNAARESKATAAQDIVVHASNGDMPALADSLSAIMEGASPDDAVALRAALIEGLDSMDSRLPRSPDDELALDWREGGYPYKNLMTRKNYEKQKYKLQVELLKLVVIEIFKPYYH